MITLAIIVGLLGAGGIGYAVYIQQLRITTSSLPTAIVGQPYAVTLFASGGKPPYTWSATNLPARMNQAGDNIYGVLSSSGTFSIRIGVTDMSKQTAQVTLTLTGVSALTITTSSLPTYVAGQPYSAQLSATGGTLPYTWTLAAGSTLPAGLTLSSGGLISGTPTVGGSFQETFIVTDNS